MPLSADIQLTHVVDLLNSRIDKLESSFFLGASPTSLLAPTSVNYRLDQIDVTLQKTEKEVPGLKACEGLILKLKPLISERKSSLKHTVEKVEELLIKEDELLYNVKSLSAIGRITPSISSPHFAGKKITMSILPPLFTFVFAGTIYICRCRAPRK